MIKTIVCTGDSHTWGQYATGLCDDFHTPAIAGDLRWTNFKAPNYVNLLRNHINQKTNSLSAQYGVGQKEFFKISGKVIFNEFMNIIDGSITFVANSGLMRFMYKCGPDCGEAVVMVNGKEYAKINSENSVEINFKIFTMTIPDDNTTVTIKTVGSLFSIYKVEIYQGEYAVINSGIGSCTTGKLLREFWVDYVEKYNPSLVIIEAQSINDWINKIDLETYKNNLATMFSKAKDQGSKAILLTVSPILGSQVSESGELYENYIKTSRIAASMSNIPIADANQRIAQEMDFKLQSGKPNTLYEDGWHVNDEGHQLYFESIIKNLNQVKI